MDDNDLYTEIPMLKFYKACFVSNEVHQIHVLQCTGSMTEPGMTDQITEKHPFNSNTPL